MVAGGWADLGSRGWCEVTILDGYGFTEDIIGRVVNTVAVLEQDTDMSTRELCTTRISTLWYVLNLRESIPFFHNVFDGCRG